MTDRYIENKSEALLPEPDSKAELTASLTKIVQNCPPKKAWSDGFKDKGVGLWTGPTSIAYLFLWLADIYPDFIIEGHSPAQWCQRYLDCGSEDLTGAADLNGWGVKNEYLAYNAVKAAATRDMTCVDRLEAAISSGFECPPVDNEHLSGRAGTLSLLRIVRHWVPDAASRMDACMKPLIEYILAAVPWSFHGHRYIGAAHGDIGILTQLVLCDGMLGTHPVFEAQLEEQLNLQAPDDGHWFITPDPGLGSPDLVHYCHGSPGFVLSLLKIRPFVRPDLQERIDAAVELGRKEVWEKGLLRKEPNLCHGITGNMLALDGWDRRRRFMSYATAANIEQGIKDGVFQVGDDPFGLLWGEAGRAWGWLMMDSGRDLGYPSYSDI